MIAAPISNHFHYVRARAINSTFICNSNYGRVIFPFLDHYVMEPTASKQPSLCLSCVRAVFGRNAWRMFWRGKTTAEVPEPSTKCDFSRKQLLDSSTNSCWFCPYLLKNVPADTYNQTISVTISYQVAGGVYPTKIHSLSLEVQGLPEYARLLLYLGVSAKPSKDPTVLSTSQLK